MGCLVFPGSHKDPFHSEWDLRQMAGLPWPRATGRSGSHGIRRGNGQVGRHHAQGAGGGVQPAGEGDRGAQEAAAKTTSRPHGATPGRHGRGGCGSGRVVVLHLYLHFRRAQQQQQQPHYLRVRLRLLRLSSDFQEARVLSIPAPSECQSEEEGFVGGKRVKGSLTHRNREEEGRSLSSVLTGVSEMPNMSFSPRDSRSSLLNGELRGRPTDIWHSQSCFFDVVVRPTLCPFPPPLHR